MNANLANREKYAAEWNAAKRIKLIVHTKKARVAAPGGLQYLEVYTCPCEVKPFGRRVEVTILFPRHPSIVEYSFMVT